jgi:hypothetical protein
MMQTVTAMKMLFETMQRRACGRQQAKVTSRFLNIPRDPRQAGAYIGLILPGVQRDITCA